MSEYRLEIGDTNIAVSNMSKDACAIRIAKGVNEAGIFEFVLFDERLMNKAGIGSFVKLISNDNVIFYGRILSEEVFSTSRGRGKYVSALGAFGWCDYIVAKDDAGIPILQFSSTSVGEIISELLERHESEILRLGAGNEAFYSEEELSKLDEPIDSIRFENCSLKSVLQNLLSAGNYVLTISPATLSWDIKSADELDIYELNVSRSSEKQLVEYRIKTDLSERCSAVKLVSSRKVSIGYASATPAWNSLLESDWRIRNGGFSQPDNDEPDECFWVYRRYSYSGISDLLESYPIELVQKQPNDSGGYSYQVIETLMIDKENKYIVSKWPILSVPDCGKINRRNGLIKGKAQCGEVYIRYRYYESEPEYSERYPEEGFSGQAIETAGLVCENVLYCSDVRQINNERAIKYWRNKSRIYRNVELSIRGELNQFNELIAKSKRVNISSSEIIELPSNSCFALEYAEYDFMKNLLKVKLTENIHIQRIML